jgi:hypothetical protein
MPTLRELDAHLIAYSQETAESTFQRGVATPADMFRRVDMLSQAHGIHFLCPKAFASNSGPVGTHRIQVYFSGSPVPPHLGKNKQGETVRWNVSGSSLDDLSLTPSIQEEDPTCGWHGFVGSSGVKPGSAE